MSSKYKPGDDAIAHFVTFTVVGWVDVFSRELYKEILILLILMIRGGITLLMGVQY